MRGFEKVAPKRIELKIQPTDPQENRPSQEGKDAEKSPHKGQNPLFIGVTEEGSHGGEDDEEKEEDKKDE